MRPEEVKLQEANEQNNVNADPIRNQINGVIDLRTFLGPFTRFHVRIDEHTVLTADIPSQQSQGYYVAQHVTLTFSPDACQVLPLNTSEVSLVKQAEAEEV